MIFAYSWVLSAFKMLGAIHRVRFRVRWDCFNSFIHYDFARWTGCAIFATRARCAIFACWSCWSCCAIPAVLPVLSILAIVSFLSISSIRPINTIFAIHTVSPGLALWAPRTLWGCKLRPMAIGHLLFRLALCPERLLGNVHRIVAIFG